MDISVAHVIETVRLAQTTAALRGLPTPTLEEYNEAVITVIGFGDDMPLQLVRETLIVGNRLGTVPEGVPKVPLLIDVERLQKRLRIPFTAEIKEMILDLRKETDLGRSLFFHRLALLDIDWAKPETTGGKGTFKEKWSLYHKPEQIVCIIERAVWGNTVEEAVQKYVSDRMTRITRIPELTGLLDQVIPANLPELVEAMTIRLDRLSAASTDIVEMMEAVPDLVNIVRYGDVRNFDLSKVRDLLEIMLERIHAGIILLCSSIQYEAAQDIKKLLQRVTLVVNTLNDKGCMKKWQQTLLLVHSEDMVHPLLAGCATRLLREFRDVDHSLILESLRYYTSAGNDPDAIAFWFEGFFENSGTLLLLDAELWGMVNSFVSQLDDESFEHILPTMRRTVSSFTAHERTQLGSKAKDFYLAAETENSLPAGASSPATDQGAAAATQAVSPEEQAAQPLIALVSSFFGKNWG